MNVKDIEPTKGNLLVEVPEKQKQSGDIILAGDQDNTAPVRGVILRVPEIFATTFKVGEEIFFRKYAIDELKFKKEDLSEEVVFIIEESEVLGVIRPILEKKPELNMTEVRADSKVADKELKEAGKRKS